MFDIHYHLLFGVDDGPPDLETSLKLAEASIAEGVTHLVATPHANDRYPFQPDLNRERLSLIEERLEGRIKLGLGCDFHLSLENIKEFENNPRKFTINQTRYLLVEFSDYGILPNSDDIFYRMLCSDVVPIITHPERNSELVRNPKRIEPWLHMGCLVQVTAGALSGRFGKRSQSVALQLLRNQQVHIIASDAHSVTRRPPAMKDAFDWLARKFGESTARRLCVENPRAVFEGTLLPEAMGEAAPRQKLGFFDRLFGKH